MTDETTMGGLKPLDEAWMVGALRFVFVTCERTRRGPTWGELYAHMGWRRQAFKSRWRMEKLGRRGLVWDESPRSLRVSAEGIRQLKTATRAARKTAAHRRAASAA